VCEECGATTQDGGGEAIRVAEEVAEMVHCDGQYIGDVGGTTHVGQHPARATQTIPPAVRRQVMRRDRGRCVVEGCHSATFVDVHHLRWRKDGGGHDIDNIAVACSSHHRAIHAGRLIVQGTPSTGLSFFHADGTPYGTRVLGPPEEAPGQVQPDSAPMRPDPALGERLFSALTNLGFKTKPARQAVEHVLEDVATHTGHPPPIEEALRGALRFLHP
jgi:hypothetical protein